MTSINEVILKLDSIIEKCKQENLRAGYFAILYRQVTVRIKTGIANGEFDDNLRMEKLDIIFASRFTEAFDAYYANQPVTESWKDAFDAANNASLILMQHLLLGINAHINLDLGIAVVQTSGENSLTSIQNDFNRINDILSSLVDGVKANIAKVSILFGWMMLLARGKDEMLLNFAIEVARDGAWKFAGTYAASADKVFSIQERDEKIAKLAGELINTGKWVSFLVRIIRFGEYRTEKENMEIMESIPQY